MNYKQTKYKTKLAQHGGNPPPDTVRVTEGPYAAHVYLYRVDVPFAKLSLDWAYDSVDFQPSPHESWHTIISKDPTKVKLDHLTHHKDVFTLLAFKAFDVFGEGHYDKQKFVMKELRGLIDGVV